MSRATGRKPRNGSTRRWRELRDYVLRRDGHTCRRISPDTGRECGRYATHAGHIVDHDDGGSDHPDNLRAECARCNTSAGARAGNRKRKDRQP